MPRCPGLDGRFSFGVPETVRAGRQILFVACGSIVPQVLEAAAELEREGLSAAVAVQAHLPGSPSAALSALLRNFRCVVGVEEGYLSGGLSSLLAETIAQEGLRLPVGRVRRQGTVFQHYGQRNLTCARGRGWTPPRWPARRGGCGRVVMMNERVFLSVVLPCRDQAGHIAEVLLGHDAALDGLGRSL